jgi:hypothetical protein
MTALPFDPEKSHRETLRWLILLTLHAARPLGAGETLMLDIVRQVIPGCTVRELRNELDYLMERELLHLDGRAGPQWRAKLTRIGADVVEYTAPCDPGIARPPKYWGE